MKTLLASIAFLGALASCGAATTITATNRYSWGANFGWVDACGDTNNGAVIGEYICSGYLYTANAGWIHLGGNAPADGIRYQNNSGTDYGVNHDGLGTLRGYAYGANIGWVNFEDTGAPKVNLVTGKLGGYAWSANCGWISLSNAAAVVQTATIAAGADTDSDGIADGWELTYSTTLTAFTASSDTDGDGVSDQQEALADTNPLDPDDKLEITSYAHTGTYNVLAWTSKPTRLYRVDQRAAFAGASPWETYVSVDLPGWNTVGFGYFGPRCFYRIRAVRPLMP